MLSGCDGESCRWMRMQYFTLVSFRDNQIYNDPNSDLISTTEIGDWHILQRRNVDMALVLEWQK